MTIPATVPRLNLCAMRSGVNLVYWPRDGGRLDMFVLVRTDLCGDRAASLADVLILPADTTAGRARDTLDRLPGCVLVATARPGRGCLLRSRRDELFLPDASDELPDRVVRWAAFGYVAMIRTGRIDPR